MKGELHERLRRVLQQAYRNGVFTQESLAAAMHRTQGSVGQYLSGAKGGAFDLDEAAIALDHIGSSLADFLANVPPRPLSDEQKLAHGLAEWPELADLVRDLMPVPKPRRDELIEMARGLGKLAIVRRGGQTGGSTSARPPERHTKSVRAQRPRAQGKR